MGMFTFEIPEELHKKFKIKGIEQEKDMRDILVELIDKFTNK